jgi:hypothetical protein
MMMLSIGIHRLLHLGRALVTTTPALGDDRPPSPLSTSHDTQLLFLGRCTALGYFVISRPPFHMLIYLPTPIPGF